MSEPAPFQPEVLTREERRAHLKALIVLAQRDGQVSTEELALIRKRADELHCELGADAFKEFELLEVAAGIHRPSARRAVLEDLSKIARVDRKLAPEELQVIKYLATRWELRPPTIPAVDWSTVKHLDQQGAQTLSRRLRQMVPKEKKQALRSARRSLPLVKVLMALLLAAVAVVLLHEMGII